MQDHYGLLPYSSCKVVLAVKSRVREVPISVLAANIGLHSVSPLLLLLWKVPFAYSCECAPSEPVVGNLSFFWQDSAESILNTLSGGK